MGNHRMQFLFLYRPALLRPGRETQKHSKHHLGHVQLITWERGSQVRRWYTFHMRKTKFVTQEFYHIYNRGVDKRDIFMDSDDVIRFLLCMSVFNIEDPIGSIYEKYKRSGSLFQGKYKATHISSNNYLLHLSVYVNWNYRVHKGLNKKWMENLTISSFPEYIGETAKSFCVKDIILGQFSDVKEYRSFCEETLPWILRRKDEEKDLKYM